MSAKKKATPKNETAPLPKEAIVQPRTLTEPVKIPNWIKTAALMVLAIIAWEAARTGVQYIRRGIEIYQQFQIFINGGGEGFDIPGPIVIEENLGKWIKKNLPRGIPAEQRNAAAAVFEDAATELDAGGIINRDDLLGFLAENLRPICRAPNWVPFLTGLWKQANLSDGTAPDTMADVCRQVGRALSEAALTAREPAPFIDTGVETAPVKPEPEPETIEPEKSAQPADEKRTEEADGSCTGGNCPTARQNNYFYPGYGTGGGGYYWW